MTSAQFDRILKLFIAWVKQEFDYDLYGYQARIARAVLRALFVEPNDVHIKISRQAGKTESVTLLLRFLIIFYRLVTGNPPMCGSPAPRGSRRRRTSTG